MTKHLSIDLGASGGKAFLGEVGSNRFSIQEIHRFDNEPRERNNRYTWNFSRLFAEILKSLEIAGGKHPDLDSIGIDGWGVDFGLLGFDGKLLQDPYSYRDPLITSTEEQVFKEMPRKEVFKETGINHLNVPNTLFQYHYLSRKESDLLKKAEKAVMLPQLLSHLLGGKICTEETLASTTQMMNVHTRTWSEKIGEKLDLPIEKLPNIEKASTRIGTVRDNYDNTSSETDIVLPASHDTGAAVVGAPLTEKSKAFLSTGTWFIVGIELPDPLLTDEAYKIGGANEAGVEGTTRFLKNVTGFFIFEECRKKWKDEGKTYKYEELLNEISETDPFGPLIDPDDSRFTSVRSDMPETVRNYCRETNQEIPESIGEISRCIFESLSAKTALVLEELFKVTGRSSEVLHLVGGGARNEIFCQMISSATGHPVESGPVESAAVGNILTQSKAYPVLNSIKEGRRMVEKSTDLQKYWPENQNKWKESKSRMSEITS